MPKARVGESTTGVVTLFDKWGLGPPPRKFSNLERLFLRFNLRLGPDFICVGHEFLQERYLLMREKTKA